MSVNRTLPLLPHVDPTVMPGPDLALAFEQRKVGLELVAQIFILGCVGKKVIDGLLLRSFFFHGVFFEVSMVETLVVGQALRRTESESRPSAREPPPSAVLGSP